MGEPLEEQYFQWLYSQVASVRLKNTTRTYWSLARKLFTTEYTWFIPNDDNRVEDGRDLRYEFLEVTHNDSDLSWLDLECSVLEMLIGLSRRLAFEAEGESRHWFWHLMYNLDLQDCHDLEMTRGGIASDRYVDRTLARLNERTYDPDGCGGLFPLKEPIDDQREVEIWYQLSAYLLERT